MPLALGKHVKTGSWTPAEDELLAEWQSKVGNKWAEVARRIPGRTGQQCAQRWRHKVNPNIRKEKWSEAEDDNLTRLYYVYGNAWAEISRNMNGRTDQQCMGRWRRHLDPAIRRDSWKEKEDASLVALYSEYGSQWSTIAKQIQGRTAQQCRARWYQTEAGNEQQSQNGPKSPKNIKTPWKKPKHRSKKCGSDDDWEGSNDSDLEGTDFEAEYLIKARARRQCSRRLSTLTEAEQISAGLNEDLSSEREDCGITSTPQATSASQQRSSSRAIRGEEGCSQAQRIASGGTARKLRSIRKRTKRLGNGQGPVQSISLQDEGSEGCETVLKTIHHRKARHNRQTEVAAVKSKWDLKSGGNENVCRTDGGTQHSGAMHSSPSAGVSRDQSEDLPTVRQPETDSLQDRRVRVRQMVSRTANNDAQEEKPDIHELQRLEWSVKEDEGDDMDSPPLLSRQAQIVLNPSGSQLLTASQFNFRSPDSLLRSPVPGCMTTEDHPCLAQNPLIENCHRPGSQTPLAGSKRNTPGGGFAPSKDGWEVSPTEDVLKLFHSPSNGRGRSNPLQSPSFQTLATPEWARRDWCSPAPGASGKKGESKACQLHADLPTTGKPLNRGPVARRLDIEPGIKASYVVGADAAEPAAAAAMPVCAHQESPAKKHCLQIDRQQRPAVPLLPPQSAAKGNCHSLKDKENSTCNALKQLSMAAFVVEQSVEDTSSADTQWLQQGHVPLQNSPAAGTMIAGMDNKPPCEGQSPTKPLLVRSTLECSKAVRTRLHALLDGL